MGTCDQDYILKSQNGNDVTDLENSNIFQDDANSNIGIGTNDPDRLLQVGSIASSGAQYVRISAAAAYGAGLELNSAGNRKWLMYRPNNSSDLRFFEYDDSLDRVTFQDGGNVGIGTTSPGARLDVRNSSTEDILNLFDDSTEVLTVLDGGNVGIGTTSPGSKLDIFANSSSSYSDPGQMSTSANTPLTNRIQVGSQANPISTNTSALIAQFVTAQNTVTSYGAAYDFQTNLHSNFNQKFIGINHYNVDNAPGMGEHVGIASHMVTHANRAASPTSLGADNWAFWGLTANGGFDTTGVGIEVNPINTNQNHLNTDPYINPTYGMYGAIISNETNSSRHSTIGALIEGQSHNYNVISTINSTPTAGGTGYTLNDILTLEEGRDAQVKVTSVSGGVVQTVAIENAGETMTTGAGKTTTGGTGTGCTVEITAISSDAQRMGFDTGISIRHFVSRGIFINSEVAWADPQPGSRATAADKIGIQFGDDLTNLIRIQRSDADKWGLKVASTYIAWEEDPAGTPTTALAINDSGNVGIGETSPNSKLEVNGSLSLPIISKDDGDSPYTASADDHTILADTSGGDVEIDLPQASSCSGRIYVIKKLSASNTVYIDPYAGDTVEGSDPLSLTRDDSFRAIQSDGSTTWHVIGENNV